VNGIGENMKQTIKDLIDISTYSGNRVDYTQGGGGNTSVKDYGSGLMLIKASGYKLKDITENSAFVAVDLGKIKGYYESVDLSVDKDYEKESAEIAKESIVTLPDIKTLRPSVEVGFHAILKKYVIHTHSVYANILTCALEGEEIAKKIFNGKDFGFVFMPYINPGFSLTLAMKDAIEEYSKKNGRFPEVIFMKNHGLVVTGDMIDRVKAVNTEVNETICEYFGIKDDFKAVSLSEENGAFVSKTPVVKEFMKNHELSLDLLNAKPLYPDQLVYLNNLLINTPEKMQVSGGKVTYNTDLGQATTLEETLSAYLFVLLAVEKGNLTLSKMSEKEVNFINNWEAEKYRRSVK